MQPYLLSPEGRIRHWKEFRQTLDETMSDEEQLEQTIEYWKHYPISSRYLDPYTPETWPTPWELIFENEFCSYGLAYMMFHTLLLSKDGRWNKDRLKLMYVNDSEMGMDILVVVADEKYVLNYDYDQIFNLESMMNSSIICHEYLMIDDGFIIQ